MRAFQLHLNLLFMAMVAVSLLKADDMSIVLTGACGFSGSPQSIQQGDAVTITLTLNDDEIDTNAAAGTCNFDSFTKFNVQVQTDNGFYGTFDGKSSGTLSLLQNQGNVIDIFAQDSSGGLPGISDGQYGAICLMTLNVTGNFSADTGGAVPLKDVLSQDLLNTLVNSTIYIEPDWSSRVEVTITSANIDGSTPTPTLPPALSDSIDYWDDPIYDNWYFSNWFGTFYYEATYGNWVYSPHIGWAYFDPAGTPAAAWLWSEEFQSWLWASSYNGFGSDGWWLYRLSDDNWLYIYPDATDNSKTWIFQMNEGTWSER